VDGRVAWVHRKTELRFARRKSPPNTVQNLNATSENSHRPYGQSMSLRNREDRVPVQFVKGLLLNKRWIADNS